MAKIVFDTPSELIDQFERIGKKIGEVEGSVAETLLYRSAESMIREWKSAIQEENLIDTRDLYDSIGIDGPASRKGGVYSVSVGAQGKDRKGVRNGLKAGVLNYGSSSIAGRHFLPRIISTGSREIRSLQQYLLDHYIATGNLPSIDWKTLKAKRTKKG